MSNLYEEKFGNRYKYIVGILVTLMFVCLYFIFFTDKGLSVGEEKDIISKIDEDYDVIETSDNYVVNDRIYYTIHSNLKENIYNKEYNKNYSDEFKLDSKTYYRIDTSYYKIGDEEIWQARYCVDKESKEVYIEFRDNPKHLIKYSDYNENVAYALGIIRNANDSKLHHIDVTIKDAIYTIHLYEVIINEEESHTATTGWYSLNLKTKEVKDLINEMILSSTLELDNKSFKVCFFYSII